MNTGECNMPKRTKLQDVAWPPTGVRDLKPDALVSNSADRVRFPILRDALQRAMQVRDTSRSRPKKQT